MTVALTCAIKMLTMLEMFQISVVCHVGVARDKKPIVITQIEDIYLVKSHSKLFVHSFCVLLSKKRILQQLERSKDNSRQILLNFYSLDIMKLETTKLVLLVEVNPKWPHHP